MKARHEFREEAERLVRESKTWAEMSDQSEKDRLVEVESKTDELYYSYLRDYAAVSCLSAYIGGDRWADTAAASKAGKLEGSAVSQVTGFCMDMSQELIKELKK